jgi:hypothetical protein
MGKGGGKRVSVGDRRRAAAARTLGVSVAEKQTLDAANERAHELYGLGIGVLVFEHKRFEDLMVSLTAQRDRLPLKLLRPTGWRLRGQAKQARRDARVWEARLAHVANDLARTEGAAPDGFGVAASPGER